MILRETGLAHFIIRDSGFRISASMGIHLSFMCASGMDVNISRNLRMD